MAELLVRVVDKGEPENVRCTKRGDVIVVMPDGWMWGNAELADPHYRILRVPDMSVSEASALLAEEPPSEQLHELLLSPYASEKLRLHRRLFNIDIDALPQAMRDAMNDARVDRSYDITIERNASQMATEPAREDWVDGKNMDGADVKVRTQAITVRRAHKLDTTAATIQAAVRERKPVPRDDIGEDIGVIG